MTNTDYISGFREGRAKVELKGKWGHIDKKGNVTTPIIYEWASIFVKGRAHVILNNKLEYIDTVGNIIKEGE